jgi:TolB-like protein/DNA-binding winged helix-turn-helix (wHTH) protein/Tfp pilus assembly protein PilF
MNGPQSHLIYEFGDFRLDATRRLLFAKGASDPLAITPKVFETILYFVERPSELLRKDTLLADLWPGLVVEENNLAQVISVVRRVLGETRGENRYLATVPGRGYRFVADVVRVPEITQASPQTPELARTAQAGAGSSRRAKPLALFVLTVCAIGAALFAYSRYAGWWPEREAPRLSPAQPSTALAELPSRTVAVLPFKNLSTDARDEFFAFGVAESVLHRLANVPDLTLIARTSSFAFWDKPTDARNIGRTLNARYLVEGSVQREGDRLRVTAQLIDAATGAHVWSLRFDRTIDDIFAVEDEISQGVARALEVSLGGEQHPFARYGIEAYLAFLHGRALLASRKEADAELAIDRFSRALELAPESAAAHAALAEAHIFLAMLQGCCPLEGQGAVLQAKAGSLLTRALQLDDSLGEAYVWRGWLKVSNGDITGGLADYEKGIALSPSYAPGLQLYGEELDGLGRQDEALELIDRARRVDPLYPRSHYFKGLVMLYGAGTIEEAEALFLQALRVAPDFHPALMQLGVIRRTTGRLAEAVNYSERAVAIDPRPVWMRALLSSHYLALGDPDAARHVIAELRDPPRAEWAPICWYENDLDGAHEILRGVALEVFEGVHYSDPYVLRAVRDQAFVRNDSRARLLMRAIAEKWDPTVGHATWTNADWQIDFILVVAEWRKSIGEQRSAEASARAALDWMEREERKPHKFEYERAMALAILGHGDAAIATLERAFAAGRHAWFDGEREPAFAALRENSRFRALMLKQRDHVSAQRKSLEQMRSDGTVPLRSMPASAAHPC